jgi:Mg2+/Co2+ transporter CorB
MTGARTTSARPFLQALWRKHRYSRVPVYKDRVDNIVGRGLHSSTSQLKLSHFWHNIHHNHPPIPLRSP